MPTFTILQWLGIGFAGVSMALMGANYHDARRLLPDDIPLARRLRRGWWANLDLYYERDRDRAQRSIWKYRLWVVLFAADLVALMWAQ